LQQTPLAQKPLMHCPADVQATPFASALNTTVVAAIV